MTDKNLVIFPLPENKDNDYSGNRYNSSRGLLNPTIFAPFIDGVIEAYFDFFHEIVILPYRNKTDTSDFSIYVKVKIPLKTHHPSLGTIQFHSQAYCGQLLDIIEKIETGQLSLHGKIHIKLEKLDGYDWFKPRLYYDHMLTTKVPSNKSILSPSILEQKIINLYALVESSKTLDGLTRSNFTVKTKQQASSYNEASSSFLNFLDRLKPKVGDFIVREILPNDDNNYTYKGENTFLVLKLLKNNVLLYPIDLSNNYISMPKNHDLYISKTNPSEDVKKKAYDEINKLIYYGRHLDVADNIDTPLFKLTTINDILQNPISYLQIDGNYKYSFGNTSMIFHKDGKITIRMHKACNSIGHYKALKNSILINLKEEPESKIQRYCLRVFTNGAITLCPFSDDGSLNNAHMISLS